MANSIPQNPHPGSGRQEQYAMDNEATALRQAFARRTVETHAAFLLPYLQPHMRLLDCGCGPGTITTGLAKVVAPGDVLGLDADQHQVDRANDHAAKEGVPNVTFEVASVYELPYPEASFDVVFSSALLEHLGTPVQALREMWRVLKPGGLVAVRIPDYDGFLYGGPHADAVQQYWDIEDEYRKHHGGDERLGKHLRALVRNAGFVRVEASASYEVMGTDERVQLFGDIVVLLVSDAKWVEERVNLDLVDDDTVEKMKAAVQVWASHPDAFFAWAWGEAVGWKE